MYEILRKMTILSHTSPALFMCLITVMWSFPRICPRLSPRIVFFRNQNGAELECSKVAVGSIMQSTGELPERIVGHALLPSAVPYLVQYCITTFPFTFSFLLTYPCLYLICLAIYYWKSWTAHPSFPSSFGYGSTDGTGRSRIAAPGTWGVQGSIWITSQVNALTRGQMFLFTLLSKEIDTFAMNMKERKEGNWLGGKWRELEIILHVSLHFLSDYVRFSRWKFAFIVYIEN